MLPFAPPEVYQAGVLPEARSVFILVGALALVALGPPAGAERVGAAPLVALPPQPAHVPWPEASWPKGPLPAGVAERLEPLLAVTQTVQTELGETRAVVIIHHGRLVAERYMPGFTAETRLLSWSAAKSITHALAGIAVRRGLIDIDKPMANPRWATDDPRARIPWRHWLNMVDGQEYRDIGVVDLTRNDAVRMLWGVGRLDVAAFSASLPLNYTPGTFWNYNSGGYILISDVLARVFGARATPAERRARMAAVLRDELFGPIGMRSAQPEFDAAGNFVGAALLYATARDFARFGLLYLRDGVWAGRRILPEGWVDFARTKTPADNCDIYGAGFWITPPSGRGKPFPAMVQQGPRDLFFAHGHEGQLIVIVPSKDLVVVRLGRLDDLIGRGALGDWVEKVVALF
jgi:CubicO group peptidase (beta-lactamase class C family)